MDAPTDGGYRGMETTDGPSVAIVDDDELCRRSAERLFRSAGSRVGLFGSAEDFVEHRDVDRTACMMQPPPFLMANGALRGNDLYLVLGAVKAPADSTAML
jgi:hypothetical protein